jgi:hypothetical protein
MKEYVDFNTIDAVRASPHPTVLFCQQLQKSNQKSAATATAPL